MKIIKIWGGLGNQMFQYAFYKRIQREYDGDEILTDTTCFDSYRLHNGLELENIFNVKLVKATRENIKQVSRYIKNYKLSRIVRHFFPNRRTEYIEKNDFVYDENCFLLKGNKYFEGYWQNYNYFKDLENQIRKDFNFVLPLEDENKKIIKKMEETNSVSIHIRRGDYLKHKLYKGLCGLSYYDKAISYIREKINNPTFFIFSNDIEWCKNNLQKLLGDAEFVYVTNNIGPNSYKDMQLMSNCKHNIIANSSFSWWAAFLNENSDKKVIAPHKWINRNGIGKIQMDDWVLL